MDVEERKKESEERNEEGKSEEPKIRESKLRDVIIQDESRGEKKNPRVEGGYKTPARKGRRRYGSRCRTNLTAAAKEIRRSRTPGSLKDDVIEKNDGRQEGRQGSATRVTCKRKRQASCTSTISDSRIGIPASRPRSPKGRRTVKSKREDGCTGLEFKNHSHSI